MPPRKNVVLIAILMIFLTVAGVFAGVLTMSFFAKYLSPRAQQGNVITGAAMEHMTAPIPINIMADGDIQQPEWYVEHVPPGESGDLDDLYNRDNFGFRFDSGNDNETFDSATSSDSFVVDRYSSDDRGTAEESPDVAASEESYIDEETPPPYGFSAGGTGNDNSPMEPMSTDEILLGINDKLLWIFICFTLCMAAAIVYLICRAVWPLFSYL